MVEILKKKKKMQLIRFFPFPIRFLKDVIHTYLQCGMILKLQLFETQFNKSMAQW